MAKLLPASSRLLIIFCLALKPLTAFGQCYYPNQSPAKADHPCDPDASSSACCGSGIGVVCLSNNLCQGANGAIIRGSCSEDDWNSSSCAHYCLGKLPDFASFIELSNCLGGLD